jgi:galactonate dehydratase
MAAIPNFFRQEFMVQDTSWRDTVMNRPLPIKDGYFELDDAPGLGFEFNEEELNHHPGIRIARPGFYV